jgi:hypothetical protein
LEAETKKRLLYGVVIVVAGGVGIFVWKKYGSASGGGAAAAAASADANAQAQASAEETQLAELSELGSSGSELTAPNIGETPVEDFGTELSQVLESVGLEPVPTQVPGSGTTASSPTSTAPGSTGGTVTPPTPITPTPAPPVTTPIAPILSGPVKSPTGGPIYFTGTMPEQIVNPE